MAKPIKQISHINTSKQTPMKKNSLIAALLLMAGGLAAQNISEVWVPDLGNGKYKNPIINADYSDPDVCRVGDDYYMTSSSFNCIPALQILHSKDLVNWTLIGYAAERLTPEEDFMLGVMLGYDLTMQCERFCNRRSDTFSEPSLAAVL